jgi:hypothetical protein
VTIKLQFVVLQNLADLEKVRGLCSEKCPASSCDAYQAVTIKSEVFLDAEEEEYPVETFLDIKAEPEVSYVSVRWISQIRVCFTNFVRANNLVS